MSDINIYNSRQVAELTGLAFHSVRIYSLRYDIGRKLGRDWIYTEADVRALQNRNKQIGRPKVV